MLKSHPLSDIRHFIIGEWRYFLFYAISPRLVSPRVRTVYKMRFWAVRESSNECIEDGACKVCGCTTPDLFFSDKACKGGCYPPMPSVRTWKYTKHYLIQTVIDYERSHMERQLGQD